MNILSRAFAASYPIVGVNWGSSKMRACLIDHNSHIIDTLETEDGIAKIGSAGIESVVQSLLTLWPDAKHWYFSGMVGSPSGWLDVGYSDCPIAIDHLGLTGVNHNFGDDVHMSIVKGLCIREPRQDVMRGEELELLAMTLGCPELMQGEHVVGLPGTHTKWVRLKDGKVDDFFTAMGSEIFDHLSSNGLLKGLLSGPGEANEFFLAGLDSAAASPGGFSRSLFSIRAQIMLGAMDKEHGASFARGVLIGHELDDLVQQFPAIKQQPECYLVGNESLCELYRVAMAHCLDVSASFLPTHDSVVAVYQSLHHKRVDSELSSG